MKSLDPVQGRPDVEWIVIDGSNEEWASHGGLIRQVISRAAHVVSEPDEGIYDAMNKGTKLASGAYVLYLNAGDELHPGFSPGRLNRLVNENLPDMVWGRCLERYENGATIRVKTRSPAWAWYGMPAYHPAIFFRRNVLGDNPYDTSFRIAADYDLVCRLLNDGARALKLDSVVSIFHRGGLSLGKGDLTRSEENQVRMKYFRVSAFTGGAIMGIKNLLARFSNVHWLRRL